ncbi:MAG: sulfur carrier protein ThiS adenylyltransferase ThiF [Brevinematales bacterium]|nr:sulfur carrier protein ThiS adenylyltransferase ThiF [Brevinematales bacterium]
MRIGIAGVGGIGSNVILHLVRAGVKNFRVVDFDVVQPSNLNRQFYFIDQIGMSKVEAIKLNLMRIANGLDIISENKKLSEENIIETFKDCEIVVEGFDNEFDKTMLIRMLFDSKKLIVSANGVAGIDTSSIIVKNISGNIFIVGDFSTDIKNSKLYSHKVSHIASLMAEIVLKKLENN